MHERLHTVSASSVKHVCVHHACNDTFARVLARMNAHMLAHSTYMYGHIRLTQACNEDTTMYTQEKHVIFSCIGTEQLRHQFIHLFDNIPEGDIKGFVFQHNLEAYKFISAAVDLFD